MARRSRSSFNPLWLFVGLAVLMVCFGIGSYVLTGAGKPYRTTATLEVEAYLENSNSLRGNVYKVEGEILNVLGYSPTQGRLISVGVNGTSDVIPMLVPAELGYVNIERGQKYIFQIEVTDQGILKAMNLTKS